MFKYEYRQNQIRYELAWDTWSKQGPSLDSEQAPSEEAAVPEKRD